MRPLLRAGLLALAVLAGPPAAADDLPVIGAPFALEATTGGTLDSASLDGRPFGLYFGFTHCPDVCPTTFAELGIVLAELGADADAFPVYFVTVDPARDTPAVLRDYLSAFDPRIVGLTGPAEDLAALAESYGVSARRIPLDGGDYTVSHGASVFLVDGDGIVRDRLAATDGPDAMAAKIRALLAAR